MRDSMMDNIDGSTVITMYKPDQLQIKVDVRFEDLPDVRLGQPVRIDNPALKEPVTGTVLFISSEADIQKNTLEVKVGIDAAQTVFKPEMLVDVTFLAPPADDSQEDTSTQPQRIFIPQNLITDVDGKSGVWVADRSLKVATHVAVQTGQPGPDQTVEITSGLNVTSRLIVSPLAGLKQGTKIRTQEKGS
jgi:multidrug efflux pump subunit AcrA (membrane-fusion protein)